jgi:hypothetical protein
MGKKIGDVSGHVNPHIVGGDLKNGVVIHD